MEKIGRFEDRQGSVVGNKHNRKSASSLHGRRTREEEERQVRRRVDELGSYLTPAAGKPSAEQRKQEMLERVRAREALSSHTA